MDNTKDYNSVISQIKKVKALSENGVGGERENAKVMLDKLLKKYKITLDELLVDDRKDYNFKFKTKFEEKILFQCLAKYAPNIKKYKTHVTKKGVSKNIIILNLTLIEFLDVSSSAKFYNKLFAKELELFMLAFISKHDIYDENAESESTLSDSDINAIMSMMGGMEDVNYISSKKQLNS